MNPITHRLPPGTVRTVTFDKVTPQLPAPVKLLPLEARTILREASQHQPRSSRVTAINKAILQVRRTFPQYFQEEI
jgi:hypothetical protein